jgi:transposase
LMSEYSDRFKAAMVSKLSGAEAKSATALAKEVGVSQNTLSRWLREHATLAAGGPVSGKKARNWTAQEKLATVLEYESLDEEARGKFLREKGLYTTELERWRQQMLQALSGSGKPKGAEKARIRDLESELRRKEKALAETAALLVLKKKPRRSGGTARTRNRAR